MRGSDMQVLRLTKKNLESAAEATNRPVEELERALSIGDSQGKSVYLFIRSPDWWTQVEQKSDAVIPLVDEVLT